MFGSTYLNELMNLAFDPRSICRVSSSFCLNPRSDTRILSMYVSCSTCNWFDKATSLQVCIYPRNKIHQSIIMSPWYCGEIPVYSFLWKWIPVGDLYPLSIQWWPLIYVSGHHFLVSNSFQRSNGFQLDSDTWIYCYEKS